MARHEKNREYKHSPTTASFNTTMAEVTKDMPRSKRLFSTFIHLPIVATLSDAIGNTLLRPNALLFGAIASFALTLLVYLFSKNLGYSLSGSESIVAFLLGWIVGIMFDIVTSLFKKQ